MENELNKQYLRVNQWVNVQSNENMKYLIDLFIHYNYAVVVVDMYLSSVWVVSDMN